MTLGIHNTSVYPARNRIKGLYQLYTELFSGHFGVRISPYYNESSIRSELDKEIIEFLSSIDSFFGYERIIFEMREKLGSKCPILLPLFADLTKGGGTLWLNKNYFLSSDKLLLTSMADLQILKATCPDCSLESAVIPLPIREEFENYSNYQFENELSAIKKDRVLLSFVGRLTGSKNIYNLVDTLYNVSQEVPSILVIAGYWEPWNDGENYKQSFQNYVNKMNLQDYVYIFENPSLEFIRCLYFKSDINLNLTTNKDENFGLSVVEAMSQGAPVVCTDWGGLKDHIINGYNGYKVHTKYENGNIQFSLDSVVEAILKIVQNREKDYMSHNTLTRYVNNYSRSIIENKLVQLINSSKSAECEKVKLEFSKPAIEYNIKRQAMLKYYKQELQSDYIYEKYYASDTILEE